MGQSQTSIAAEALVNAVKQYDGNIIPSASSPVWRKVITESLGIKKLYTSRLNKILEAAKILGLEVSDDSFAIKREDPPKIEKAEVKEKPFSRKTGPQYMGRLLESELKGLTARLDDGQAASVTFCVCPGCGKNLKLLGVANGVFDDPGSGDMAE